MAEGVVMLRILGGGVYSGLSERALKIITRNLMREEKAMCRQRQSGSDVAISQGMLGDARN